MFSAATAVTYFIFSLTQSQGINDNFKCVTCKHNEITNIIVVNVDIVELQTVKKGTTFISALDTAICS